MTLSPTPDFEAVKERLEGVLARTYEGGEWLSEFPRPNPILRTLLRLVTCVPCIIAVCIVAVEVGVLVRGGS